MDIKLADGRELVCDLNKVTIQEYRQILRQKLSEDEEAEMVGKIFSLTADEYNSLPFQEWRRVTACLFATAREPLDDGDKKKSESEPIKS